MMNLVERELALRAYLDGFAAGADPARARRRHRVDPTTHAWWMRGFDAGRKASDAAKRAFLEEHPMSRMVG